MTKRGVAGLLLLLLLTISTLSGCSAPLLGRPKPKPMSWDGTALTGAEFHERHLPLVTIHYADPTRPSDVERLGKLLQDFLASKRAFGRFGSGDRLDMWVVPGGYAWPDQLWIDNLPRRVQAAAPRIVVIEHGFLPRELARDEQKLTDRVRQWQSDVNAIYRAVATSVTQAEGSAAYRIGWIQDGMGGLFLREYVNFPGAHVTINFPGSFNPRLKSWSGEGIVATLNRATPDRYGAADALAAVMAARYGLNWPVEQVQPGTPFPPYLALRNLAKLRNPKVSNPKSVYREAEGILVNPLYLATSLKEKANRLEPIAAVDKGANRLVPSENIKAAAASNHSPTAYRFDLQWSPASHTIGGEQQVTWTNGEGVPIDRLYFNVWGNSTRSLWYGGETRVEAVSVEGQPAAFTFQGMDLEVALGRHVGPGETVRLSIRFATRLPTEPPGEQTKQKPWEPPAETWPMQLWYPTLAVLDQQGWQLDSFPENGQISAEPADYTVRIAVPPGSRVETDGPGEQSPAEGGGTVYEYAAKNAQRWAGRMIISLEADD